MSETAIELVGAAEVGRRVGRSPTTVLRWAKHRGCPVALRLPGGEYRFRMQDVLEWLGAHGETAPLDPERAAAMKANVKVALANLELRRRRGLAWDAGR